MVLKKKTSKTTVTAAPMEESVAKEPRKPAVTQVVEVIEEAPAEQLESTSDSQQKTPLEDPAPTSEIKKETESVEAPVDSSPQMPEDPQADEKRKVLVDELFQKKIAKPIDVTPEISMHTKRKTNPIVLWAIGMIATCLVVGGGILIFSGKGGSFPSIVVIPTPTATPTPKETPTPTPEPAKRESLTIQVLNGGGVPGAATKMKKALEDKGYKVTDTGNASEYTYDKTEILVKSSKKDYIALLEEDLKESYTLGSSAATLEDSVSYDARVIVGKE